MTRKEKEAINRGRGNCPISNVWGPKERQMKKCKCGVNLLRSGSCDESDGRLCSLFTARPFVRVSSARKRKRVPAAEGKWAIKHEGNRKSEDDTISAIYGDRSNKQGLERQTSPIGTHDTSRGRDKMII